MSKSQIGVRIPDSLLHELNSYIQKTGTNKTEVVCSAIAEYLGCVDSVPLSQRIAELEKRITILETRGNE
ncbi:DNA-binding domain-containing protein [Crocosphaera sp. UHCC 0190]|uniref:DNA-binding domain-containing protein n=1 Tax=Crocosphaera sp. UHCC 0190 TaxID=3110246 RepID=UPI002B21368A|nr:DNA-binding domain-containing protein [Crocosphaera sp. UHCC 0190]MEA5511836.1 DNA-binding domain-containing protein [Crocosphaera sp. UHCC 0190]